MKMINKNQIKVLHAALNRTGQLEFKREIIHTWTSGRTSSSKELTYEEAKVLIDKLNDNNPFDKMRKKIFSLAYEAGIIYGHSDEDNKINAAKLNMFLRERGAVKMHLNNMNQHELKLVINQFSAIVKKAKEKQITTAVNELLNECGITNVLTKNK